MSYQPSEGQPVATTPPTLRRSLTLRAASGVVLGVLIGMGLLELGIKPLDSFFILACAAAGMILSLSRPGRGLLWVAGAAVVGLYLLIAYTPMMRPLMHGLDRRDEPRSAPAVVVLGTSTHEDGSLGSASLDRFLAGYTLLREGYAPRLVITNPQITPAFAGWAPAVERQMHSLGLNYPIDLVGPVTNTFDEANAVAKLARERHWDSVLLVTHPWHMKRAAAVFEKAGVHVICSPCLEGRYDLVALDTPDDRLGAWRDWIREAVAYKVYQLRGRI